jgi:hypothetical protein
MTLMNRQAYSLPRRDEFPQRLPEVKWMNGGGNTATKLWRSRPLRRTARSRSRSADATMSGRDAVVAEPNRKAAFRRKLRFWSAWFADG